MAETGLRVALIAGTTYEEILEKARDEHPELPFEALEDVGMEDLLPAAMGYQESHRDPEAQSRTRGGVEIEHHKVRLIKGQ